ncbi:MAG: hypothetical protein ACRD1K_03380 [Acidimicrobiales bacterium]
MTSEARWSEASAAVAVTAVAVTASEHTGEVLPDLVPSAVVDTVAATASPERLAALEAEVAAAIRASGPPSGHPVAIGVHRHPDTWLARAA